MTHGISGGIIYINYLPMRNVFVATCTINGNRSESAEFTSKRDAVNALLDVMEKNPDSHNLLLQKLDKIIALLSGPRPL